MEKTTLKRIEGPADRPDMIEGSEGPIIFPFAKIDDEYLRVHRNQLVHHNSEIAILVAHKSQYNVSIKSRQDLSQPSKAEEQKPGTDTSAAGKPAEKGVGPVMLAASRAKEYHPEVEGDSVVKDDDTEAKSEVEVMIEDADRSKRRRRSARPMKFSDRLEEEDEDAGPSRMKRSGKKKKVPRGAMTGTSGSMDEEDGPDTVFEDTTQISSSGFSSTSDDTVVASRRGRKADKDSSESSTASDRDSRGIRIPKSNVKQYFQWQYDKLVQQIEDEERCTQSDISVYNIQQRPEDDPLGVGEEALHFHKIARKQGDEDYANRFLLLVGHCILALMKKPAFLDLSLEEVHHILSSDYFGVAKERNVLRAAYAWLQHRPERKRHTAYLMGAVRFGLLTKKEQIKCLAHNQELLAVLLNVPPFQRAFLKSCLWNYAQDAGLHSLFKEFMDHPRLSYRQYYTAGKRNAKLMPGHGAGMSACYASAMYPGYCHAPVAGFSADPAPFDAGLGMEADTRSPKVSRKAKKTQGHGSYVAHVSASTAVLLETTVKMPALEKN